MDAGQLGHQVETLAAAAVRPCGLLVEEVTVTPAGRRRIVRVSLDRDLAGLAPQDETSVVPPVSLDEIAAASAAVDAALDGSAAVGEQPYVLEVSSPGVGRPLTQPRHFRRNVGRLVELTLADGAVLAGRLTAAGAAELTLALTPTGREPRTVRRVPFAEVANAQVQVEFGRGDPDAAHGGPAAGEEREEH